MKKIIIYCTSLDRGGAERVTVYLTEYLIHNGIECEILTERFGKNEYAVPDGVKRVSISSTKKPFAFKKVSLLRREIKKSGADTVLVMGVPNCIWLIPACLGLGVKVIVSERNDPKNFAGKKPVKILSRFLMRFAHGFVFQTNDAKAFYDKKLKGRGQVIFNPLITDNLPNVYEGQRTKAIVTAGRLVTQKNQKMLISAFADVSKKHPEYNLIIYGEGPLRETLEAQAAELGIKDKVFLPGNTSDLLQHTKNAAIFVLPSDFEGMPNALIEAMAIGLPCISTDCPCGGPRELITDGQNGILVPVRDGARLTEAMIRLIEDQALAHNIGERAAEIRNRLNSEVIGRQWIDYLSGVSTKLTGFCRRTDNNNESN